MPWHRSCYVLNLRWVGPDLSRHRYSWQHPVRLLSRMLRHQNQPVFGLQWRGFRIVHEPAADAGLAARTTVARRLRIASRATPSAHRVWSVQSMADSPTRLRCISCEFGDSWQRCRHLRGHTNCLHGEHSLQPPEHARHRMSGAKWPCFARDRSGGSLEEPGASGRLGAVEYGVNVLRLLETYAATGSSMRLSAIIRR